MFFSSNNEMLSTGLFTKSAWRTAAEEFTSANENGHLAEFRRKIIHRLEIGKPGPVNKFPLRDDHLGRKKTVLADGCQKKESGSGLFRLGFGPGGFVFPFHVCIPTFPFFDFVILSAHK